MLLTLNAKMADKAMAAKDVGRAPQGKSIVHFLVYSLPSQPHSRILL